MPRSQSLGVGDIYRSRCWKKKLHSPGWRAKINQPKDTKGAPKDSNVICMQFACQIEPRPCCSVMPWKDGCRYTLIRTDVWPPFIRRYDTSTRMAYLSDSWRSVYIASVFWPVSIVSLVLSFSRSYWDVAPRSPLIKLFRLGDSREGVIIFASDYHLIY